LARVAEARARLRKAESLRRHRYLK
jgi:hypothetical protein